MTIEFFVSSPAGNLLQGRGVPSKTELGVGAPLGSSSAAPMSSAVEIIRVSRSFGKVKALDDVTLSIHRGEFFSLLGPSGCGKTTLLRVVAGLELPDHGELRLSGREATGIPAHQRPVNTVFQSYALFPHLNVWENVAFGLRMKRTAGAEIKRRVQRIMESVQIAELATRRPSQLSGGQKQRVALARAIVNEPEVLLLDEPLGALDLKLRKQLQRELHELQRRLGLTFIYVTHDQDEALVMSDRIAVMNGGKIEQIGSGMDLYEHPKNRFVAEFVGSCNLLSGVVAENDATRTVVRTAAGLWRVAPHATVHPLRTGDACTLAIRPEKVRLSEAGNLGEPNWLEARVTDVTYTGSETQYLLQTPAGPLRSWMLNDQAGRRAFTVGREIAVQLPPEALHILDD